MRRLLLHIGMHKTGTTTLQNTLFAHRDGLAGAGMHYVPLGANHSRPMFSIFSGRADKYPLNRRAGLTTKQTVESYVSEQKVALQTAIGGVTDGLTVISGEDISLLRKDAIPGLKNYFAPYFDAITIVVYVRPARSFINSMTVQAVKGGAVLAALEANLPAPDYQWRFNKFIENFGAENVYFRLYDPKQFRHECIVADFLEAFGLYETLYPTLDVTSENTGLSQAGVEFLSEANARTPLWIDDRPNPARDNGLLAAAEAKQGPAFSWDEPILDAQLRKIDFDIKWMEHRLGHRLG